MTIRLVLLVMVSLFVIGGCATTPQIQISKSGMEMEVKSEVPLVLAMDRSPDGKTIVTGGSDGVARVWDLANARQAAILDRPTGIILGVRYLPDGKTIAVSTQSQTTLWNAATAKPVKTLAEDFGGALSFSPDGRLVLGISHGGLLGTSTLELRDVRSGELMHRLKGHRGTLSPNGRYVAVLGVEDKGNFLIPNYFSYLTLLDTATGQEFWTASVSATALAFSPDSRQLVVARQEQESILDDTAVALALFDVATGAQQRIFGQATVPGGFFSLEEIYHQVGALNFAPDGKTVLSGDQSGRYKWWDAAGGRMIRQLNTLDELAGSMLNVVPSARISPDGRTAIAISLSSARVFELATGNELATLISFADGEWLITTPSGYYSASEKGDQYLNVSVGGRPYSMAQTRESFFRPDLVKLALTGQTPDGLRKVADIKPPPAVAIVETPSSVASEETTVRLRIADQGGGIGDVRLYLNGSAIVLDRGRERAASTTRDPAREFLYKVRLVAGRNSLRAIAFNADNSMQSTDALHLIEAHIAPGRPSLHAIVIGIQDYENPKLQLMFPAADARLIVSSLKSQAPGLFDKFNIVELTTRAQTTKEAITRALRDMAGSVRPDDLFVFFVASHGTVDDGEYFLITSNVGSTSTHILRQSALSQDDLKVLIANVPATKKLIMIDTCNAGKLGEAIQSAVLTRGMSEDTALKILSRAVGSTVISASTSLQEALEGYQGHGLFTWVVAAGLAGAADSDKDGYVKTHELVDYVDSQVPELAERVFRHKQYPTTTLSGQGYPVVKLK